uniref:ATPase AAA-type core domain-containing protein n=1 Tax=Glossina brevipalpis TaxID=37001 RepID=A0A1A9WAA2_9MUSC
MDYLRPIWNCFTTFCSCLHCSEDPSTQGYEPSERTHLLADPVNHSPALHRTNSDNISNDYSHSLPKKDDQNALCRLVQNTALNMIDVGAMDSHNLENQECQDRIQLYKQRLLQQWSNVQHPSRNSTGILRDIPNPEVCLTTPVLIDDIIQFRAKMSFQTNYKLWVATKKDLDHLVRRQSILKQREPIEEKPITFKIFTQMYVLYADLVEKLARLYTGTLQVQKREIIRDLLDAAGKRLTELKNELKAIELSEFLYLDKELIERKLIPHDLLIWRSPEFLYRRPPELQDILCDNQLFMSPQDVARRIARDKAILSNALILIQAHERARQARVYRAAIKYDASNLRIRIEKKIPYTFTHKKDQAMSIPVKRTIFNANYLKPIPKCRNLLDTETIEVETVSDEELQRIAEMREAAALVLQSAWRAYRAKTLVEKKKINKLVLYGMVKDRRHVEPKSRNKDIIETYKKEIRKKKLDQDFAALIINERARLLQERTPWIMEDISDHIRAWFREFYDKLEDFHPYPEALKGGTVLLVTDETMSLDEFKQFKDRANLSKEEKKKLAEKEKQQKQKEKEKLKKEKIKEAKRRKKLKDAGVYDIAYDLSTNPAITQIEILMKQYSIDWRNIDEYLNQNQVAIKEWVTESELAIIHKELRALVDEYMILEYEMLRKALAADQKKKYIPTKQKKPKEKKKKNKKKRVSKDLTADRTIESLYEELAADGIIEQYSIKTFNSFVADFNYVADDKRDEDGLVMVGPAKADLKAVIQESMFGMGQMNVDKPKSLCIVGPFNNGKKLLVNIIASEMDAVLMNLSPEKTAKYSDKINYLLHVIMKVARAFQPTIIFINDAHRVFWRKVPKDQEDLKPQLLAVPFQKKLLKPIKKTDRIMIVGTTDQPWAASGKFNKAFQKMLLIPRSEYGSLFLLWLEYLIQNVGGEDVKDYMVTALTKVFRNYQTGDVVNNINITLNIERRMRLHREPLQPFEIINYFLDRPEPIFPPDEKVIFN